MKCLILKTKSKIGQNRGTLVLALKQYLTFGGCVCVGPQPEWNPSYMYSIHVGSETWVPFQEEMGDNKIVI